MSSFGNRRPQVRLAEGAGALLDNALATVRLTAARTVDTTVLAHPLGAYRATARGGATAEAAAPYARYGSYHVSGPAARTASAACQASSCRMLRLSHTSTAYCAAAGRSVLSRASRLVILLVRRSVGGSWFCSPWFVVRFKCSGWPCGHPRGVVTCSARRRVPAGRPRGCGVRVRRLHTGSRARSSRPWVHLG